MSEVLNNMIEIDSQVIDSQVIEIDSHVKRKLKPVALAEFWWRS